MRKVLAIAFLFLFMGSVASAQWATTPVPNNGAWNQHYPQNWNYPHYGHFPYQYPLNGFPQYFPHPIPTGYITCYAQGTWNGAWFYGIGINQYYASQWALYACANSGQYCHFQGCRYY